MSRQVREMFARIAARYDLANDVLSFGQHHRWRRRAVAIAGLPAGSSVLDCACGTGDLAFAFKRCVGKTGRVVASDFCPEMLEIAARKAKRLGLEIEVEKANLLDLPYASASFDAASIAFGIRNVDDVARGIAELARVVKPGGQVLILEFGQPESKLFGAVYQAYSSILLPLAGGILTGSLSAYSYLQRTSSTFPCGAEFSDLMMSGSAFSSVGTTPVGQGIAYIYQGFVPGRNVPARE